MIPQSDELLHSISSPSDWEERFHFNFADKKTKTFCSADLIISKPGHCMLDWAFFGGGIGTTYSDTVTFPAKDGTKIIGGKGLKYKISKDTMDLSFHNPVCSGDFTVQPFFSPFDYPVAPGRPTDQKREDLEVHLWKRYSQRCRFSGSISPKKGSKKKIEALGQRVHSWGDMLWKQLSVSSSYQIQFKEMSINLSCLNFGGTLVSNGFISRKSGNIPVVDIELEHFDFLKDGKLISSEISYLDSQDDKDLIVTHALFPLERSDYKIGKQKFIRIRSFSEFSIIGANKKGVGFEEHFVLPEVLPSYTANR
jgi:hypothetical protein